MSRNWTLYDRWTRTQAVTSLPGKQEHMGNIKVPDLYLQPVVKIRSHKHLALTCSVWASAFPPHQNPHSLLVMSGRSRELESQKVRTSQLKFPFSGPVMSCANDYCFCWKCLVEVLLCRVKLVWNGSTIGNESQKTFH